MIKLGDALLYHTNVWKNKKGILDVHACRRHGMTGQCQGNLIRVVVWGERILIITNVASNRQTFRFHHKFSYFQAMTNEFQIELPLSLWHTHSTNNCRGDKLLIFCSNKKKSIGLLFRYSLEMGFFKVEIWWKEIEEGKACEYLLTFLLKLSEIIAVQDERLSRISINTSELLTFTSPLRFEEGSFQNWCLCRNLW